ncbi:DUF5071 domain-containing protein [Lysinibacillus sp. NPDC097195]|uniref:DUF5071 domain-containing protein n=1 Tax=Lysinibacillus sp. NPDC097195 TaxID=3364141 RepID=UPI00381DCCE3
MDGFASLLPKNIYDIDKVEELKKLDRNILVSLLPELLVFIQDTNWPVAPGVLEILRTFPNEIIPYVLDILSSDDDNWKWYVLHFLVIELPKESRGQFQEYLTRVAENPTANELAEELDEIAKQILETL